MKRQSASAYFTWDITWTLFNACNPTFYWPVKCTQCSCRVCPRHGAHSTEKAPFLKLIVKFFLKSVAFMFWHDIVYIDLLYCVTNFELAWIWNKVRVVENAKKSVDWTPPSPKPFQPNGKSAPGCDLIEFRTGFRLYDSDLIDIRCAQVIRDHKKVGNPRIRRTAS